MGSGLPEAIPGTLTNYQPINRQMPTSALGPWWRPGVGSRRARIEKAVAFIDEHVADPGLNVATVARALSINATYLSHIFAEETGTRMSRYIATRRVELAKELLSTTEYQVKRIALQTGHSNPDWFSQIFRSHTGMTPLEYRRRSKNL